MDHAPVCKALFSRSTNSSPDPVHDPEKHDPEWTQSRMDTIPNGHNPEWTQSRKDTIPKGHNPERALTII